MNRLWVRLALAFVLVVLVTIVTTALLAQQRAGTEFRLYLGRTEAIVRSGLVETLAGLYRSQGNWNGVESFLGPSSSAGRRQGRGPMMGMGYGGPTTLLADADGRIIYDINGRRVGEALSRTERENAFPVEVDGRTVGLFLMPITAGSHIPLPAPEQDFLDRLTSSFLIASLLASLLGVGLGIILARGLTAPLHHLVDGARALAQRNLSRRVETGGSQEIEEVGHAFNEMASSLESAEQQRQHLMADIAHELRTPLTVLQGNLQALLDGVYPLRKEEITRLYDETRLLNRLVDDLRELAQAEAGKLTLRQEAVELAALLQIQAAHFRIAAEEKGISLTVDAPETLPPALADPDRTAQVIRNLLNNALHHTPSGGHIALRLALEPGSLSMLSIEVADSGEGIAPEDLPRVFDRFWRADRARSRQTTGGSGLGLAIARTLVEGQGGQIGVESEQGQGALFWFTLPTSQPNHQTDVGS